MNYTNNIDYDFVSEKEGASKLSGYSPLCNKQSNINKKKRVCFGKSAGSAIGKSGSAIGRGFDFGQPNLYDLQKLQLPPDLQLKLIPYMLHTKNSSIDFMYENPLVLSEADAEIINVKKKGIHIRSLIKTYNLESKTTFSELPGEVQTVLFSITYQFGLSTVKTSLKGLWKAAVNQNWQELFNFLHASNTYVSRRKSEAELIRKVLPK